MNRWGRFMTRSTFIVLGLSCALVVRAAELDPRFYGFWDLDVAKSDFGPNPPLKSGMVSWNENGFAFAIVLDDGHLYTDGTTTRAGCGTIGLPKDWTCEFTVVTSRHAHLVMKQNGIVRRIGDIELLKDGATRTTHHVYPEKGKPYVEKTIWVREPG